MLTNEDIEFIKNELCSSELTEDDLKTLEQEYIKNSMRFSKLSHNELLRTVCLSLKMKNSLLNGYVKTYIDLLFEYYKIIK